MILLPAVTKAKSWSEEERNDSCATVCNPVYVVAPKILSGLLLPENVYINYGLCTKGRRQAKDDEGEAQMKMSRQHAQDVSELQDWLLFSSVVICFAMYRYFGNNPLQVVSSLYLSGLLQRCKQAGIALCTYCLFTD